MPLYDYVCNSCKFKVELLRESADDTEAEFCKKCGGLMTRQFPAASFLEKQSETNNITKKLTNKLGGGNDHADIPHSGPRMWPANTRRK